FTLGRRLGALSERLGRVGDLVIAPAADRPGLLRFGQVRLPQPGALRQPPQPPPPGRAPQRVGFRPHRLEVRRRRRQARRDHVAAPPRLLGEGGEQLVIGSGFVAHSEITLSTVLRIRFVPKAPSIVALTTPSRLIANSHGSVGRWNRRTWGRTPFEGSLSL